MIGTILYGDSRARDSKVRSLAFFLGVSALWHGAFFPEEWLWLGAGLAFLLSWEAWSGAKIYGLREFAGIQGTLTITDGLLFILIGLSLLGLGYPVKRSEGWMDALRWGSLWMVYHQAQKIPRELEQGKMLAWIERIGVFLAILAWIRPLSFWIQGHGPFFTGTERLSSFFGYSNALGVYLAVVLLLHPRSKIIQALLFLSLLNTGSRAAVFLFLIVWSIRGLIRQRARGILPSSREGVFIGIFVIGGLLLTLELNPEAFRHLLDWGIQNSLGERLLYIQDGLKLAWANQGMPRAGGWFAFPVVQNIPYWTTDPHSMLIRVLLNQGVCGVLVIMLWVIFIFGRIGSSISSEWSDRRLEISSALLFLGLHSMIDVDFLFGTLGILFWTLFGMLFPQQDRESLRFRFKKLRINFLNIHSKYLKSFYPGLLFLLLGLMLLDAWVYPQWLDPQKALEQEMVLKNGDEQGSLEILQKSLADDQTQLKVRREIASLELKLKGAAGLDAAENVLTWEKFDIRTYEWLQGRVLEEAEKRRSTDVSQALTLYQWSESLPSRVKKVAAVSAFEKGLWIDAANFQPSELMKLLESTAKDRQLTLR